jgi:hypothetical protein
VIHSRGESFDAHDGAAALAVAPDSAVVTILDAHFLFTTDFTRKGPDLVLTGEDGHKVLVPDYFRHEKHPDLVSSEGAILSASVVELLSGSAAPGQYAQDGPPVAQHLDQPDHRQPAHGERRRQHVFCLGTDVIAIDHTVFADFQALLGAVQDDANGNAMITADLHDTITIKNVTSRSSFSTKATSTSPDRSQNAAAETPLGTSDMVLVNRT